MKKRTGGRFPVREEEKKKKKSGGSCPERRKKAAQEEEEEKLVTVQNCTQKRVSKTLSKTCAL